MTSDSEAKSAAPDRVSFGDAVLVWAKIGLLSFGGPAGQIALMHQELVETRKWIDEARFLHALNYCMLLPGPEATQLATYVGWLMHRTAGGVVAGTLFVLPGALLMLLLSALYATLHEVPAIDAMFDGLKAAVLAVVLEALIRIGKRALVTRVLVSVAALAFVAIFFFEVPFPAIVAAAALIGALLQRVPGALPSTTAIDAPSARTVIDAMAERGELAHTVPSRRRAVLVLAVCIALWALPLVLAGTVPGAPPVLLEEGLFFSQSAMVTFGGAYSVLAWVGQRAVETYHWLAPGEMLDGLGLAETTPGPLILVLELVGFVGAYRQPGTLSPLVAGVLGAGMTLWVTFVPCFLWIFLGAPWIEALRGNRHLRSALTAITASVVGVILNLSIWLALHALFGEVREEHFGPLRLLVPVLASIDPMTLVVATLSMIAMLRLKVGMVPTLAAATVLGALWRLGAG